MLTTHKTDDSFIDYDINDTKYAGAESVVLDELEHLKKTRQSDPNNLKGIALSGGGIRSASFCLGVMQTLARHSKLKAFDYLSTVSGGSYLGGSLSWLWLEKWKTDTNCNRKFGTAADNFPYGSGSRHSNNDPEMDQDQAALMRHLRQHGKYLLPGKGITALSFLSVILRSISMGFITLLVLLSFLFHLLYYTSAFDHDKTFGTNILEYGIYSAIVYMLCLLSYGFITITLKRHSGPAYLWRRYWEKTIPIFFIISASLLTIALVIELTSYINSVEGGISALVGSIIAWFSQKSDKKSILKIIPKPLLVNTGVALLFIGLFVLSDKLALAVKNFTYDAYDINLAETIFSIFNNDIKLGLLIHAASAIIILLSAYLIPINKVSIHRYYRDRLMETFTPDACKIIDRGDAYIAKKANEASLHDCLSKDDNTMPYHIINTNIILVKSKIAKFKGRGGDNFILSPLYSGANATGWRKSEQFANGSITLPTAIAISGAAANSDSGVAGKGLTINPLVSALMSIFNLRLGYWTTNPNPKYQSNQDSNPNYLSPGFRGIVSRNKLNEQADFIQLSDGGHFENLAMYELLRRHCRLIVCCDGEEDKGFVFASLSNIIEKARVDFGIQIKINETDLERLRYTEHDDGSTEYAEQGYLIADIIYPKNETVGKLIYFKTTLIKDLPADVMGYKNTHLDFPDESTADQFFDEVQMEAYRMLGTSIAESMINNDSIKW